MALIELASSGVLDCAQLVVCLDRSIKQHELATLMRDLGWVGFELTTLKMWMGGEDLTSTGWLFLAIES
jgi:hypothetical protein